MPKLWPRAGLGANGPGLGGHFNKSRGEVMAAELRVIQSCRRL